MPKTNIRVVDYDREYTKGLPITTRGLRERLEDDLASVMPRVCKSDYYSVIVKREALDHYDRILTVTFNYQKFYRTHKLVRTLRYADMMARVPKRRQVNTNFDSPKYVLGQEKEQNEYFWDIVRAAMLNHPLP